MRNIPERERDRDVGRLGGIAQAAPRRGASEAVLRSGAAAGATAAVFFLLFEIFAAWILGPSWSHPLRQFASVLVGEEALSSGYPLGTAAAVGIVVDVAIGAFWGVVFAWLASASRLTAAGSLAATGVLFGLLVWVFDFYVVTLFARAWFREANVIVQAAAHVFFYGLPLGILLARLWRTE